MTRLTTLAVLLAGASAFALPVTAKTFNLAFTPPLESHYGDAGKAFKTKIEELSGGDIEIALKPAGALGGERDVIEGLQIGTVELTISSTGPIGNFVPQVYALDFPFLFKDYASAHAVLDGEIGQEILADFEPAGLVGLAWAENGFRHITDSKHPIRTPDDLKGIKLRTMENEVHIAAFKALGAAPTPMSWTEVLTSLQQGTIDGQENPVPIITANNMWEIQKYASLTGHVYSPAAVVISKITWDELSPEEQGWMKEAAKAAAEASRATVAKNETAGVEKMIANGMEVVTDIDKAAFAAAVQPVYDEYAPKYSPELIQRIRDAQK
ncbi:tripartite ATP-independent transporter DctP family solute receptor [Gemmobacter caeni]|uniref:Tripartite ATP-independent transporter DctP family solute receptor n=1 Tax=Gemmobacter caeni TaxID=589035 RepID=A0A2T6AYY7_9RHOB|nr:TRAP transporter substrate-binding protein [Gemmobacter caeni]PTX49020.1 tripartite ATP-independent transporter DctP family solute receptor [Gemmobacter caeni]TWI98979.1 tripartite ATP-independent transporter DctP family solute receptor [Gemmobacter caeni]